MSGWEKIIKTPKKVENIENYVIHIQEVCLPDSLIYDFTVVNKVVKQDLEMKKIWVKFIPKSLTRDQRDDIDYISRM